MNTKHVPTINNKHNNNNNKLTVKTVNVFGTNNLYNSYAKNPKLIILEISTKIKNLVKVYELVFKK